MRNSEEDDRLRRFAKAMKESADKLELSDDERREIQRVGDWTGEHAELVDPFSVAGYGTAECARALTRLSFCKLRTRRHIGIAALRRAKSAIQGISKYNREDHGQ